MGMGCDFFGANCSWLLFRNILPWEDRQLKMITKEAFESSQYKEMKNVDQDGWPKCLLLSTYSVLTYYSMLHKDVQLLCQYFIIILS